MGKVGGFSAYSIERRSKSVFLKLGVRNSERRKCVMVEEFY
jgi:hypothetical protein